MMGPSSGLVSQIRAEWHEWEQQFRPPKPPKGIPNREALRKAAAAEAARRSELPENVAKRTEFARRLRSAQKAACGLGDQIETRLAAIRETRKVLERLRAIGFTVTRNHAGSVYLDRKGFKVRVSDHVLPQTPERQSRRSWATSRWQIVVTPGSKRSTIEKWLARVERECRKCGGLEVARRGTA